MKKLAATTLVIYAAFFPLGASTASTENPSHLKKGGGRRDLAGAACGGESGASCATGLKCWDGSCVIPLARGESCTIRFNDTSMAGSSACAGCDICVDGVCADSADSGKWYTNWEHCVKDCSVSAADACCAGNAAHHDVLYDSMEECCSQPAHNWNHQACVIRSQQCCTQARIEESLEIE